MKIKDSIYDINIFRNGSGIEVVIEEESNIYTFETQDVASLAQAVSSFCFKVVGCIHTDGMIHCYGCRMELTQKIAEAIKQLQC